jgi:hypothetical protein
MQIERRGRRRAIMMGHEDYHEDYKIFDELMTIVKKAKEKAKGGIPLK